ncbi:MAG: glycosyltransferase family 2 protein [Bacteroidota bacterium]
MKDLSVVIVNYNVEYFLEQCLLSVEKAAKNINAEIFVVDNNSVDGSVNLVKEKFPFVKLIENKKNTGFSFANNQAIKESNGKYVLLLNPDTLVEEDTFEKIIKFMNEHQDAGGLGVLMVDGKGIFLPESKRGLPTPMVAFYKIFGLSALFPKSKIFGRYHLGYLDKNKTHEIEILSGAFMLIRKKVLDEIGLLDETFFMYGEDIDLSYRITKAGYKNYYFPETKIIHYKGESTKKSSVNYVFIFYRAMIIFAEKHFSQKNAKTFSALINLAIYLRATLAIFYRFISAIILPLIDTVLIYTGIYFLSHWWEGSIKNSSDGFFPEVFFQFAIPGYILIWLSSVWFWGGYDKPISIFKILKGFLVGTLLLLVIYALLPENYRFSRGLIVLGSLTASSIVVGIRYVLNLLGLNDYKLESKTSKKIVIIGNFEEAERVKNIIVKSNNNQTSFYFLSPDNKEEKEKNFIGSITQLKEIIEVFKVNEVIFCAKDLSSSQIISNMLWVVNQKIEYKIAPPESLFIIGSNSINSQGELYVVEINSIGKESSRRNKRVLDIFMSLILTVFLPIVLLSKKRIQVLLNILPVFFGSKTWVSYAGKKENYLDLPKIPKGVFSCSDFLTVELDENEISKLNQLYSKDYKVINDLEIIWKALF